MHLSSKRISETILIVLSTVSLLLSGCSDKADQSKTPHSIATWEAHIPSSADILLVADMADLKNSDTTETEQTQNALLKEKAGFSQDDVSTLVVACDLDSLPSMDSLRNLVSIDESGQPDSSALRTAELTGLNATVLLVLDKSITWEQVRAATDVMFQDSPDATITEQQNSEQIKVIQASSTIPLIVELSESRKILILSTSKVLPSSESDDGHLNALFRREREIRTNGAVRLVVQTSEAMRRRLQNSIAEAASTPQEDPTAAMIAPLMTSFTSFTGLAMSLTPGDSGTKLEGSFDMGSQEDAVNAESVIQNVMVPLITLGMTQYTEGAADAPPLLQDTQTSVQGSKVLLRTQINSQAVNLQQPSSAK